MRSLGPLPAIAVIATLLCGCGKSEPDGGGAGADGPPAASAEPTATEKAALLAALPAPYNTADLANGQAQFALCASCHTLPAGGPNMTGPNLHGVLGRPAGQAAGYQYSDAMKAAGFTWDAAHIDQWITNPRVMLPGTKMTFVGLSDPKDRSDLIAYLMVENHYKP